MRRPAGIQSLSRHKWLFTVSQRYHEEEAADKIADFFEKCQKEKDYWDTVSQGAFWSAV